MAYIFIIILIVFVYAYIKGQRLSTASEGGPPQRMEPAKSVARDELLNHLIILRQYSCGGSDVQVVGESNYMDHLRKVLRGGNRQLATLIPEGDNPHDPLAVRVEIDDQPVGYLSRADAKTYRKTHADAIADPRPVACWADLYGGTSDKPNIGVALTFDLRGENRYKRVPQEIK